MKNKFATLYNSLLDARRGQFASHMDPESLTEQSHAKDADITVIMGRYAQNGGLLPQIKDTPLYGDFSEVPDFRQMQETLKAATDAFMEVPAKIRARFGHDMQEFANFVSDPENADELVKMGLASPKPEEENASPPISARTQIRYGDDGEYEDNGANRDARNSGIDATRGSRSSSGEDRGAVRERQGVQPPGDRKPR